MKKRDKHMGAVLDLLKDHPELVRALIVDHVKVKRLLKTKAARALVAGVDLTKPLMKRGARAGRGPAAVSPGGAKHPSGKGQLQEHPDCWGTSILIPCRNRRTVSWT